MTPLFFIAHARADQPWVEDHLLPGLGVERARVLLPEDLPLGMNIITAWENAVERARYTLMVISQAFLDDCWVEHGGLLASSLSVMLAQPRAIVLRRGPVELPLHQAATVTLDCTGDHPADWERAFARLRRQLVAPADPLAHDSAATTPPAADQPVSADAWKRDIEEILHAIVDRMDELEGAGWDQARAIFERLETLDIDGRRQDAILEHLRATLTEQDKRVLKQLLPTLRTISEGVAASAIWHALIKMFAAL